MAIPVSSVVHRLSKPPAAAGRDADEKTPTTATVSISDWIEATETKVMPAGTATVARCSWRTGRLWQLCICRQYPCSNYAARSARECCGNRTIRRSWSSSRYLLVVVSHVVACLVGCCLRARHAKPSTNGLRASDKLDLIKTWIHSMWCPTPVRSYAFHMVVWFGTYNELCPLCTDHDESTPEIQLQVRAQGARLSSLAFCSFQTKIVLGWAHHQRSWGVSSKSRKFTYFFRDLCNKPPIFADSSWKIHVSRRISVMGTP